MVNGICLYFSSSRILDSFVVSMETVPGVPGVRFLDSSFASNATVKVGSKLVKTNDMTEI